MGKARSVSISKIVGDITERKQNAAQIAALALEAEHRTRNVLATVQTTVCLSRAEEGRRSASWQRGPSFAGQTIRRSANRSAGRKDAGTNGAAARYGSGGALRLLKAKASTRLAASAMSL